MYFYFICLQAVVHSLFMAVIGQPQHFTVKEIF